MSRAAFSGLPPFATTGIGSLPFPEPAAALAAMRAADLDVPYWPQLPRRSFLELMVPQAARAIPFLAIDEQAKRVTAAPADERPARLAETYERVLSGDAARFALSPAEAAAWAPFVAETAGCPAVKGQLTGPVTLALGAVDEEERPIFFDPDLRDAATQATAAAARYQAEALGAERRLVIVSADEPMLGVLGTASYLGVTREDAQAALAAVLGAIREAGAMAAVHCCGAGEWELVAAAGADVLFADAFAYGSSLVAAARSLGPFLARGGRIGWGLVPTDDAHVGATVEEMLERWRDTETALVRAGLDRQALRGASLLTPACGCGSLAPAAAADVWTKLRALRARLRGETGAGA
jgi:methionine synthase II (cobalamin-independent)